MLKMAIFSVTFQKFSVTVMLRIQNKKPRPDLDIDIDIKAYYIKV